jgi:hypothetical protein
VCVIDCGAQRVTIVRGGQHSSLSDFITRVTARDCIGGRKRAADDDGLRAKWPFPKGILGRYQGARPELWHMEPAGVVTDARG